MLAHLLRVGLALHCLGMCVIECVERSRGMASRSRPQQRNVGWFQEFPGGPVLRTSAFTAGSEFSSC